MVKVTHVGNRFLCVCSYEYRNLPRNAGFLWDPLVKRWYTTNLRVVDRLREYCDDAAVKAMNRRLITVTPWPVDLSFPRGLTPYPFQLDAARFALARNRSYLALDPGCISGDASISVNRGGCARRMKLSELFHKFHGGSTQRKMPFGGKRDYGWDLTIPTKVSSVNEKGILTLNTVTDVLDRGEKPVLEIKAKRGAKMYTLRCTYDHEIMGPRGEWIAAGKLNLGDKIKTNGLKFCSVCKRETDHATYLYAKYYGECKFCARKTSHVKKGQRGSKDRDGYIQVYGALMHHPRAPKGSIPQHILKMEAKLNGLTYRQWLIAIRNNDLEGRIFVPKTHVVHHKNGVKHDNRLSNLELLTIAEHARHHEPIHHIKGMVVADAKIISIEPAGRERVYDIVMADPFRNFVADGVVVHNCGKTICAALIAQAWGGAVLFICPPHLVLNTIKEFSKWYPASRPIKFADAPPAAKLPPNTILVVPDSVIQRDEVQTYIHDFAAAFSRRILFTDECHRVKNAKAKRSKALYHAILPHFVEKAVFLSGTPMPNRPMELFPVLSKAAPEAIEFMSEFEYAKKYCAAFKTRFGWDYSGASNTDELFRRVKAKFMLRLRKEDVLKDLPPKTEELVFIGERLPPRVTDMEKKILAVMSPEDLVKGKLLAKGTKLNGPAKDLVPEEDLHIATYRRELGLLKAKEAVKFIKTVLDEGDEALIVFAIHKEVIKFLQNSLAEFSPLVIVGDTSMPLRHEYVEKFQTDKTRRLFIGNIQAAGTGITLTKATRVIFAEFSWVPGDNDQASDRAHRIGQRDNVFVNYLIYDNSLDRAVLETVFDKRKVIAKL